MNFDLPLYAVQRLASDHWLVRAPSADPCTPAVRVIAVLAEPSYSGAEKRRGGAVIRSFRSWQSRVSKTRAEIGDIAWPREGLFELARLLDHLDTRDIERFCLQRAALAHELRRLARWAPRC
jgi:hypothetical protein